MDTVPYGREAHVAFLATWKSEYKDLSGRILLLKHEVKKRLRASRHAAGYDQNILRGLQRDAMDRLAALKAARERLAAQEQGEIAAFEAGAGSAMKVYIVAASPKLSKAVGGIVHADAGDAFAAAAELGHGNVYEVQVRVARMPMPPAMRLAVPMPPA